MACPAVAAAAPVVLPSTPTGAYVLDRISHTSPSAHTEGGNAPFGALPQHASSTPSVAALVRLPPPPQVFRSTARRVQSPNGPHR